MDTARSGVAALSPAPEHALASPELLLRCRWDSTPIPRAALSRKTAAKAWVGLGGAFCGLNPLLDPSIPPPCALPASLCPFLLVKPCSNKCFIHKASLHLPC